MCLYVHSYHRLLDIDPGIEVFYLFVVPLVSLIQQDLSFRVTVKLAASHFANETRVYPKSGQYNMLFNITAVLSLLLGISIFICPILVAMKIVLSTALTPFGAIVLKSENHSLFRDICVEAPESYIVIRLDIPSSRVLASALLTIFEEKV